jgi:hypothetical protein
MSLHYECVGGVVGNRRIEQLGVKSPRLFVKNVKSDLFGIETRRLDEE